MSYTYPEWLTPLIIDKGTKFGIEKVNSPPEGTGCLKIAGKKKGTISSFTKYFKNEYSNSYVTTKSPQSASDETWIFFYAYGNGDSTDFIQLMCYQTVYLKGVATTILQKAFTCKIPLGFKGWKSVAIRYSDLSVPSEMEDNVERLPKDLSSIEFSLVSESMDGEAEVYLDHLMIIGNK
jgi:hypothetical protein